MFCFLILTSRSLPILGKLASLAKVERRQFRNCTSPRCRRKQSCVVMATGNRTYFKLVSRYTALSMENQNTIYKLPVSEMLGQQFAAASFLTATAIYRIFHNGSD